MTTKYRAFALMKNQEGETWRVDICDYKTEKEAVKASEDFKKKYENGFPKAIYSGFHRYYIISHKEWSKLPNTGISIQDGKTKTWMTNEGKGCVLIFEGTHFEII